MKIALTGNPNSGKTTMFNALTGRNEKVGNWAGVTVEKKTHALRKRFSKGKTPVTIVDLPGAYSLSPFTAEESITRDYVLQEKPDVILNIVDAANLSRSLFFTTQLLELGIPVVVALNKTDITAKKGTTIDARALSARLGCPVVETISTAAKGLREAVEAAIRQNGRRQSPPFIQGEMDLSSREAVEAADRARFAFVDELVSRVEARKVRSSEKNVQDKVDELLTSRYLGIPVFALVMFFVFQISQGWLGPFLSDTLVAYLEGLQDKVVLFFADASPLLSALFIDGMLGGLIAVISFLPLVMVMYFLIALLEDCGYMARVSVVLDPIFKKVGLSGKSVIPFVIATGCAVPGVMACRTIRGERERRATAMLAPFMPCGAKLPVISLFAGAFFENAPWVGTLMYFVGIVIIFFGALLVNRITGNRARKSFFIMELPEYKAPSLWRAFGSMCSRGWAYIVKATTVILLCNTAVHLMQTFTWQLTLAPSADASILASIASPFAYVLAPIVGVLSWQLAAAAVTGLIAKENVVGTLAVCFVGLQNLVDAEEFVLLEGAGAAAASVLAISKSAALAYLMFNLFTPPCVAAMSAMRAEMKSGKWLFGGLALQMSTGYTVSFLVYQLGTLMTTGSFGYAFLPGLLTVIAIAVILVQLCINGNRKAEKQKEKKIILPAGRGR